MFGKLLKYEFKSIGKWYFALNAAIIAIACLLSLILKRIFISQDEYNMAYNFGSSISGKMVPLALSLTFGALIAGSLLSTLLIIINRFSKNIFGRQGYLTLTLPVSDHQIILSKCLVSFVCSLFNFLILGVAIVILVIPIVGAKEAFDFLKEGFTSAHLSNSLLILLYFLTSYLAGILLIYLAISIGQLFSNKRGLMAFIAYFTLSILISLALTYINTQLFGIDTQEDSYPFGEQQLLLILSAEQFVITLISYFATHFIIKNKLNIQ
ncbi:ABC transporter permease [Streptococcus ictaluri]|uniref:ABC transporter, ATP-binding protein n=1 Tax=Streptococcus ictaluri 707-05 TaxID=764299 RepID=G5K2Q6_9STRE|nr:hypothetical protein [Streptococcus ictaluri]EHI69585.1 ABC transporter, ATP-binding protein [Streptococcus ictaluri 707-05]